MKKNSTSNSAPTRRSLGEGGFFNVRLLAALVVGMTGISLALFAANPLGRGAGSSQASAKKMAQLQQKYNPGADHFVLPPGFDCSKVRQLGIDRMENLHAGRIMIACGLSTGGKPSPAARLSKFVNSLLPSPLAYGGTDVDLVTGTETPPHIIQSETFTTANPDNPDQIVVCYNDSRGANTNNFSGCSVSNDGGLTFTRLTTAGGQSPFTNTFGDPVVLYNQPTQTWFTVWLDGNGSCTLGGYKSTTPDDPNSWTHFCVHNSGFEEDLSARYVAVRRG
jgi:hypothetical protein